jgi:hypothetical protein
MSPGACFEAGKRKSTVGSEPAPNRLSTDLHRERASLPLRAGATKSTQLRTLYRTLQVQAKSIGDPPAFFSRPGSDREKVDPTLVDKDVHTRLIRRRGLDHGPTHQASVVQATRGPGIGLGRPC